MFPNHAKTALFPNPEVALMAFYSNRRPEMKAVIFHQRILKIKDFPKITFLKARSNLPNPKCYQMKHNNEA